VQDTLDKVLAPEPSGFGVLWTCQLAPFQLSASVKPVPKLFL
jgi:hypothetical protein